MADWHGVQIIGTPVVVDRWRDPPLDARVFFLSHFHTDHMDGLTDRWNRGRIHCTAITKRLIQRRFGFADALVTVIPLGEPTTVPLDPTGHVSMTVTAVDANHCPGSAMFLFEGFFGRVRFLSPVSKCF
jgi:DNA cross-link repair 1B protein